MSNEKRYVESLGHGEERVFHVKQVLYEDGAGLQRLEIVETVGHGKVLFINGQRQSGGADEFVYHEMLVHPAMFHHRDPRTVFIAGGGEGATAREVLRHAGVESVTQVDIDRTCIDICRKHLPEWSDGAYDNDKVHLVIEDAWKALQERDERYDVILIDLPEWSSDTPAQRLYTAEFYELVRSRLRPDGVMGLQIGPVHPVHLEVFMAVAAPLKQTFPCATFYSATELRWGFGIFSDRPSQGAFDEARVTSKLRYYNASLHREIDLGALPEYLKEHLDRVEGPRSR